MAIATGQMNGAEQVSVTGACQDCHIEEVLDKLEHELVGLKPVKTRIREIAALLLVDRLRKQMNLSADTPTLHMSFTGNPGTGKTTVALRMAEILHRLGYIRRPEVVSVTRDDLVGQYIGHTAPKTKEVLKKAMGGVLFIDEAYYLYKPDNERDYGAESIEILLQMMENNRDDLVVILAGYKDNMDRFFQSNPGMRSRIAHHIDFPDYEPQELLAIAKLILAQQNYRLSAEAEKAFVEYLPLRMKMPQFANARSVRNALDRARLRQANRLYAQGGMLTREQLMTIEPEDILASRVFGEGKPDGLKEEVEAEKKTSEIARKIDNPVARTPDARREVTSEQYHAIQDNLMQTNMKPNELAQHNSPSADAGFGGMPHTLPPAQLASRWQKHTKERARASRPAQFAPRREELREPPKVVNGHCEFGQCENETQREDAEQIVSTPANMKLAPLTEQVSDSTADAASGFSMTRESHAPRVIVRRVSNMRKKVPRDRAPQAPPQIDRPVPVVVNGRCEFGQCEAPPKVEEASTTGGQSVTGTLVERSSKVTGIEPGSCKKITGTEYIGPDQYTALCAGKPYVPPAKVGVTHTVGGAQRVTGTEVGRSVKVTGDERGTGKTVTGTEYLSIEQFETFSENKPMPAPAKVGIAATRAGQSVSGTEVGRSAKVTGDEPGSCLKLTGSQYYQPGQSASLCRNGSGVPHKVSVMSTLRERPLTGTEITPDARVTGAERGACASVTGTESAGLAQYQACNHKPVPAPEKVGVMHTWHEQPVSGTSVERSPKVTGDESGGGQSVSGTDYIGPDQYAAFCESDRQAASRALMPRRSGAAGAAMTGIRPGPDSKVTGATRGERQILSGTPYSDTDRLVQQRGDVAQANPHPLTRGPANAPREAAPAPQAQRAQGNFSIATPARSAQDSSLNRITGTAYGAVGRITGPVNLAVGLVSGTPEFRYRDEAASAVPVVMAQAQAVEEVRSRLTGDGREGGFAITGAAWRRNESVTGTEGPSTRRNPTFRGDQRGAVMGASQLKDRERPELPMSRITGSSGSDAKGSAITYSGGARG